jgi:hypothetical protein
MPDGGEPARMGELWVRVLEAWSEAGRPGKPRCVAGGYFALGPRAPQRARAAMRSNYAFNPELADRLARATLTTRDAIVDAIGRKAELGVDEFILRPAVEDIGMLELLAEVVE